MDVFTYTPGGAETLEAFNLRLKQYAAENDVVGVVQSLLGSTLVLSLTLASDGAFGPFLVQPIAIEIPAAYEAGLEKALTQVIEEVKRLDDPEKGIMSVPMEVRTLSTPGTPRLGFVVLLVAVGELEVPENG